MEGMMIIVYIPSSTYDEDDASLHDLNGRDALCLLGSKPNYLGMIKLDQVHACMYSWMDFLLIIYYATSHYRTYGGGRSNLNHYYCRLT